jgi:hypothetical protein
MVDFASEIFKQLKGSQPPSNYRWTHHSLALTNLIDATERRTQVLNLLNELKAEAQPVIDLMQDTDVIKQLKQDKLQNLQYLAENHQVSPWYQSINAPKVNSIR